MARTYNDVVNADGLYLRYGRGEGQLGRGGQYHDLGAHRVIELDLVGTDLNAFDEATDPTTVLDYHVRIPKGAYLEKAELEVEVAFAGASATLDIGLVKASDMAPAFSDLDDDGIDAAIAVTAIDAVGDTITCDGALIGTVLATDAGGYLISAEANTASFTAGKAKLRVFYHMPLNSATD